MLSFFAQLCRIMFPVFFFFFSSRRRHTRWPRDWSSDVCSSDLPLAGPHGRRQSHHRRLWLGDDTVPVMHDERIAARPSNVLGLPVTVACTHPPQCRGEPFSHASSSVINPLRTGDDVEVLPVLVKVGPQSPPGVVPS